MPNNNLITVTMPLSEFNAMEQREDFWRNNYNTLLRIVKKYAYQDDKGFYTINSDDSENLSIEIEDFLNENESDGY